MPDTDVLVSELTQASAINTNDLMLMTQPDAESQTGYASRKGTVLQVATKVLKNTEYTTDLANFENKTVFGALNEIHNGVYLYKENQTPYQYRPTPITANRTLEKLIGCSCAFNQLVQNPTTEISVTANEQVTQTIQSGLTFIAGHKYLASYRQKDTLTSDIRNTLKYNDGEDHFQSSNANNNLASGYYYWIFSPSNTASSKILQIWVHTPSNNVSYDNFNLIDLTACFGSEVADYFYNLETQTTGAGVAKFRQLFPESYYAYQTATLMSAKPVSKKIYDSSNNVIAEYPLGSDEIRGVFKIENGELVAYGDIHNSDGTGVKYFEERAYASGDENLPNAITDGTKTVVALATPVSTTYTAFSNPMLCGSTEEFTDSRSVKMLCGHDSLYYTSNFKYW